MTEALASMSIKERWQQFDEAQLAVVDFDGSMALTSDTSPSGMDVPKAYVFAVGDALGTHLVPPYVQNGGLRNRAPDEIVAELMPERSPAEQFMLTTALVEVKLALLTPDIGSRLEDGSIWPKLVPGFAETWQSIYAARENGQKIDTAVLSSGHTPFIQAVLRAHELPQPDIFVTNDEIRALHRGYETGRQVKPSPLLAAMVHLEWLRRYGLADLENFDYQKVVTSKGRICVAGDDPVKDGKLAANAGFYFQLVGSSAPDGWSRLAELLVSQPSEAARA